MIAEADASSFDDFYRAEYPHAAKLAFLLMGDRETAAELAQDVFSDAHRRWDRVGSYDRPDLWLRRAVINRAKSKTRRRRSEQVGAQRLRAQPRRESVDQQPDSGLWELVRTLPLRQAQAITLVYGFDLSVEGAAEVMKCAEGTIKAHLSRGRAALAAVLGEES